MLHSCGHGVAGEQSLVLCQARASDGIHVGAAWVAAGEADQEEAWQQLLLCMAKSDVKVANGDGAAVREILEHMLLTTTDVQRMQVLHGLEFAFKQACSCSRSSSVCSCRSTRKQHSGLELAIQPLVGLDLRTLACWKDKVSMAAGPPAARSCGDAAGRQGRRRCSLRTAGAATDRRQQAFVHFRSRAGAGGGRWVS